MGQPWLLEMKFPKPWSAWKYGWTPWTTLKIGSNWLNSYRKILVSSSWKKNVHTQTHEKRIWLRNWKDFLQQYQTTYIYTHTWKNSSISNLINRGDNPITWNSIETRLKKVVKWKFPFNFDSINSLKQPIENDEKSLHCTIQCTLCVELLSTASNQRYDVFIDFSEDIFINDFSISQTYIATKIYRDEMRIPLYFRKKSIFLSRQHWNVVLKGHHKLNYSLADHAEHILRTLFQATSFYESLNGSHNSPIECQ